MGSVLSAIESIVSVESRQPTAVVVMSGRGNGALIVL